MLVAVGLAIVRQLDLPTTTGVDEGVVCSWLQKIEGGWPVALHPRGAGSTRAAEAYQDHPYHNYLHGADVVNSFACILLEMR